MAERVCKLREVARENRIDHVEPGLDMDAEDVAACGDVAG